ncbi:MAG TPA: hypothetical protein DEF79_03080 [Gammaproteobacteria bacterium]|nr:hypothetical protein [Gammaproteobacteria bacterium]
MPRPVGELGATPGQSSFVFIDVATVYSRLPSQPHGTLILILVKSFAKAQPNMNKSRLHRTVVWYASIILLACFLSGCGQKGGLKRPDSPAAGVHSVSRYWN